MGIVNRIGEPEQERLGLLMEENAEVILEGGKILRHGIDSFHPDDPSLSNAQRLELEAGHVLAAIELLVHCGTFSYEGLFRAKLAKLKKLRSWMHCGTNLDALEEAIKLEEQLKESREEQAALRGETLEAEAEKAAKKNQQEAAEHRCDGTNIAQAPDGTFYCAHCGWNDPTPEGNRE